MPTSRLRLKTSAVPSRNLPNQKDDHARLERRVNREKSQVSQLTSVPLVNEEINASMDESVEITSEPVNNLSVSNINYNYQNDSIENSTMNQSDDCLCSLVSNCEQESVSAQANEVLSREEEPLESPDVHPDTEDSACEEAVAVADKLKNIVEKGFNVSTKKLSSKDIGVQVDTKYKFIKLIKNEKQLSTVTGIDKFDTLKKIVECVKVATNHKYEKNTCFMKTEDRVVMTYVKLKQNLSYSFLAVIFDCVSVKHLRQIFLETIRVLGRCLEMAIPWPSKEEVSKNIPECFEKFEDTRIVVDCTEIFIQRPKNLCCQILTYSHYKSAQTAKIMTGVTPAGNISFISKPYGGRASDSAIFEQSALVKLLEPRDGVMVDKGFLIEELCNKNQFRFIQPPFLRNKKFSQSDSIISAQIAKARVHVERSNQRIKVFKILGSVMPVALVPYLQDIFTVICGTVNLSAPIIGEDKFMVDEFDVT